MSDTPEAQLRALQALFKEKELELERVRGLAKTNEAAAAARVKDLSEQLSRKDQEHQQVVLELKEKSSKIPPTIPADPSAGAPSDQPLASQTERSLANSLTILRNQVISLADPAKKEEMLQQSALSVMTLQDSDDMYRATAKVGKNKKFELPLSLNPALTEVQENPFLLPLILHPVTDFDHDAAQQRAATVTLGLSGRYHIHSSNIVAEITNLITGMPLTLKLLSQSKTTAKGIFECLLPTLEAIAAKILIMQKRDNDRKMGRGGRGDGRGGRGAGGRRGGLRGGRFGRQQYGNQYPFNRYNHGYFGPQQGEDEQAEQEASEPVGKRSRTTTPRGGRGRTGRG